LKHRIWSWLELEMKPRAEPEHAWRGHLCERHAPDTHTLKDQKAAPLNILPPQLKQELLGQLCAPLLTLHPFFHELDVAHPQALPQVIECLEQVFFYSGQEIFAPGNRSQRMHFVAKGECLYIRSAKRSKAPFKPAEARIQVSSGQHVSEASLWLQNWTHQGQLMADGLERCEAWALDSGSFGLLMRTAPCELWQAAASYAAAFARRAAADDFTLTDVDVDIETLLKLTDEAFADALKFLAQEALGERDDAVVEDEVDIEAGKEPVSLPEAEQ